MNLIQKALFLSAFCLVSAHASAGLVSGTEIIAAPSLISDDTGAINSNQQGFDEIQNTLLTSALSIDGGSIAAGTYVDSHMIFLNTAGDAKAETFDQVWTFTGAVLGIIQAKQDLLDSNYLGNPGTTYELRIRKAGLEAYEDSYLIDGNKLTLSMIVTEPGDWIRVITAAPAASPVPVPGAVWLFGSAFLGLLGVRRKYTQATTR